jgi:WD40 repeat protein
MAEMAQAAEYSAAGPDKPMDFDAFLSYAHRDKQVATAIQKGLHRIGRRFGQLRALRVFRDDTNLEASPDLWGRITAALDRSRFMIVVLSPRSAGSHWVTEEVGYWLEHRGPEHLLLVLAEGNLSWDTTELRFDPSQSDAAPLVLTVPESIAAEPLYIDVSADAPWDLRSPSFRDKLTSLAAPIHGKPKDELTGDDLREQRRFRRLRAAAVAALTVLTVLAMVGAFIAVTKQKEATKQRNAAVAERLVFEAEDILARKRSGDDAQAFHEVLAAHALAGQLAEGGLLDAAVQRQSTAKTIDTGSQVQSVTFSPDGHRLASASFSVPTSTQPHSGTVQLWNADSGQPLTAPISFPDVLHVAFSADGHRLAAGNRDGDLMVWDVENQAIPVVLHLTAGRGGVGGAVNALAFSPDGHRIATASFNGTVRTWNADSGRRLSDVTISDVTGDIVFSPDLSRLAAGSADNSVRLWDIQTGHEVGAPLIGHTAAVKAIAFSPDGHRIAAASHDSTVQIWNADTGQPAAPPTASGSGAVYAIGFSRDGHLLATGDDNNLRLWNADTGQPVGQPYTGQTNLVDGVAFNPNGLRMASASWDHTVRLWDIGAGQPLSGHTDVVSMVAFNPSGQQLASSSWDGTVRRWDLKTGLPIGSPLEGSDAVAFISGGTRLLSIGPSNTALIWDADTGALLHSASVTDMHEDIVGLNSVAINPDESTLASGRQSTGDITIWNAESGQVTAQVHTTDHASPQAAPQVQGVSFSPEGNRLATITGDAVLHLQLWDTDTGRRSRSVPESVSALAVAFSPDGRQLATANGSTIAIYDIGSWRVSITLVGHTAAVNAIAFSPDGHHLASASDDNTVRIWNLDTGQAIGEPLTGNDHWASLAFSRDGDRLAAGNWDGTVHVWPAVGTPEMLCSKLITNMSHKQWHDWVSPDIPYTTVCPGLPTAPG